MTEQPASRSDDGRNGCGLAPGIALVTNDYKVIGIYPNLESAREARELHGGSLWQLSIPSERGTLDEAKELALDRRDLADKQLAEWPKGHDPQGLQHMMGRAFEANAIARLLEKRLSER